MPPRRNNRFPKQLDEAIRSGDFSRFVKLSSRKGYVNSIDINADDVLSGHTLMESVISCHGNSHHAAAPESLFRKFVEALLSLGFDKTNQRGVQIPIFYCVSRNYPEALIILIGDYHFPYKKRDLPVNVSLGLMHHVVAASRCNELLPRLFHFLGNSFSRLINERGDMLRSSGDTPLIHFVKIWQLRDTPASAIFVLINHGADPFGTNGLGMTILHVFAQERWPASSLMWDQMRLVTNRFPDLIDKRTPDGKNALFYCGSGDMVRFLVTIGMDCLALDNEGRCAAFYATHGVIKVMAEYPFHLNCIDRRNISLLWSYFLKFRSRNGVRWKTIRFLMTCDQIPHNSRHGPRRKTLLGMIYSDGFIESDLVRQLIVGRLCDPFEKDLDGLDAIGHLAIRTFHGGFHGYCQQNPFFSLDDLMNIYGGSYESLKRDLVFQQIQLIVSITGTFRP